MIDADTRTPVKETVSRAGLETLRGMLSRDGFGGPRAAGALDLLLELSDPETVVLSYPKRTPEWAGQKLLPKGADGSGEGVKFSVRTSGVKPGSDKYYRSQVGEHTSLKAESDTRSLFVKVGEGSLMLKGVQHRIHIAESAFAETPSSDTDPDQSSTQPEAIFELLRQRLYADEVAEIVAQTGPSGEALLETFYEYIPIPSVGLVVEPRTEVDDPDDDDAKAYYVNGTSVVRSFNMSGEVPVSDGEWVRVSLGTSVYEPFGNEGLGYIDGIKEIVLTVSYKGTDDSDSSSNKLVITLYLAGQNRASMQFIGDKRESWGEKPLTSDPLPQSVYDFMNRLSSEFDQKRIHKLKVAKK